MKLTTALATLIAGIGAGMGVYSLVSSPRDSVSSQTQPHPPSRHKIAVERSHAPRPVLDDDSNPASSTQPGDSPEGASETANALPPDGQSAQPELTHDELLALAAKVEQEANHELARLIPLLNLTEEQQDQVFMALAAKSRHFVPGMLAEARSTSNGSSGGIIGTAAVPISSSLDAAAPNIPATASASSNASAAAGGPAIGLGTASAPAAGSQTSSAEVAAYAKSLDIGLIESLLPYLEPEQQDALIAEETDRAAWWDEVLAGLMTDSAIPEVDGSLQDIVDDRPDTLEEDRPTELAE